MATGAYGVWDTVEERYVDEVRRALHDVPVRQRRELVAVVEADLAERPPAERWEHLVAEVGDPVACAEAIRVEHGLPAHVGVGAHLRAVRWSTWVVLVAVVVLVAGGAGYQRWSTADPGIHNFCSGVPSGEPGLTDPRVHVEDKEAAGASEYVVSYVDGARVVLSMCLGAKSGVEVLDVTVTHPSLAIFQPTAVHAGSSTTRVGIEEPLLDGPVPISRAGLDLAIVGRLTNCEAYRGPGGGMGFDTAQVTYRYRGRTRTVPVPMGSEYTFSVRSADDCPGLRDGG